MNEVEQVLNTQILTNIDVQSQNQKNKYSFVTAVEAFKDRNMKKTLLYLHKFLHLSLNDCHQYSLEFDKSGFSGYLIDFIDFSTNLEILYIVLDILINITHYKIERRFIFSLTQRNLYEKLNNLLQNPVNLVLSRKALILLRNIALTAQESRDELLSKINFSFLLNSKIYPFYSPKDIFTFFSKLLLFPLTNEAITFILNLVFPKNYNRCKENGFAYFKCFVSFLFCKKYIFNNVLFKEYLQNNEVFEDLINYLSHFPKIKPKTKKKILSIFSDFMDFNPHLFKSLTPQILDFIKSSISDKNMLESVLIQGYSILLNQLFVNYVSIYSIEELQEIVVFLLKYERQSPYVLKRRMAIATTKTIPLLPITFAHSHLETIYKACNNWIISECGDVLINTLFLVFWIQNKEESIGNSCHFLDDFVEENIDVIYQILENYAYDKNIFSIAKKIIYIFDERNKPDD